MAYVGLGRRLCLLQSAAAGRHRLYCPHPWSGGLHTTLRISVVSFQHRTMPACSVSCPALPARYARGCAAARAGRRRLVAVGAQQRLEEAPLPGKDGRTCTSDTAEAADFPAAAVASAHPVQPPTPSTASAGASEEEQQANELGQQLRRWLEDAGGYVHPVLQLSLATPHPCRLYPSPFVSCGYLCSTPCQCLPCVLHPCLTCQPLCAGRLSFPLVQGRDGG